MIIEPNDNGTITLPPGRYDIVNGALEEIKLALRKMTAK